MQMQGILQQASSCSVSISSALLPQISNHIILCSPSMDDYAQKSLGDRKQSSYTAQLVCIHFRMWFCSCFAYCPHISHIIEPYALCLFQGQKEISVREPHLLILKCCIISFFPCPHITLLCSIIFSLFLKVCIYLNLIFQFSKLYLFSNIQLLLHCGSITLSQ